MRFDFSQICEPKNKRIPETGSGLANFLNGSPIFEKP